MCNHEIRFSNDAGKNDILNVKFVTAPPETVVNFSVGDTFTSLNVGATVTELENRILQVAWPSKLYITIKHSETFKGKFQFEFDYIDLNAEAETKAFSAGFSLKKEVVNGKQSYLKCEINLTRFYLYNRGEESKFALGLHPGRLCMRQHHPDRVLLLLPLPIRTLRREGSARSA